MFDIGFGELVVISVLGLLVLGPERLPVAIRTIASWVKIVKGAANSVKDELTHELKIQEMHDNLKKAEQQGMKNISPELQESIDTLREAAASVTRPYADSNKSTSELSSIAKLESASKPASESVAVPILEPVVEPASEPVPKVPDVVIEQDKK